MADPEVLCFSEYIQDFQDKDFRVEEFISKCRKKVTIECLRKDLDAHYRTLKSAMVELINKDYADFVNLSANLVGMDKSISDLMTPLSQLQEEISSIKVSMESAIQATDSKLAQRSQIIKEKDILQRLLYILDSVEKLERLLKVRHLSHDTKEEEEEEEISEIEQLAEKPEFAPLVMERVASEFNKLQYNVKLTDHPLVEEIKPRIAVITSTLQSRLEDSFRRGLESGDKRVLMQSLQTYASISRYQAAETFFRVLIVHPYMEKVISTKALLTHPGGLSGLFADILKFIPECCAPILDITCGLGSKLDHPVIVKGFDFLVNSVWPEVLALIEKKISVIFAPGNPDTFHKNYTSSMEFVSSFEKQCRSLSSVKALRTQSCFNAFMSKWSLPVYFQIRFQDIAGTLEASLGLPLVPSSPAPTELESHDPTSHPPYSLELFTTLEQCVLKCWSDEIFIPTLVHRFWKLTLQLLLRVSVMLDGVATSSVPQVESKKSESKSVPVREDSNSLPLPVTLKIIHDCELFHNKINVIFSTVIKSKLSLTKDEAIFKDCLNEANSKITLLVPKFASLIVQEVAHLCIRGLESASTLPRLYRRTNREIPSKPASYVSGTLLPFQRMVGEFPGRYRLDWSDRVISELTNRYFEIGSDLLTSVQRTEESLLKLKSYRKSLVPSTSPGAMTDDNKIRLQLALDIEQFSLQVLAIHSSAVNLPAFKKLLEMGQTAKKTALATSPP